MIRRLRRVSERPFAWAHRQGGPDLWYLMKHRRDSLMARAQAPGPPPGRPEVVDPWIAAAAQRMDEYGRWVAQRTRAAEAPGIADGAEHVPAVPGSIADDDEVITFGADIQVADEVGIAGEASMQEPRLTVTIPQDSILHRGWPASKGRNKIC